ncbi:lysophospholipid acyltransferase family protein [Uliginosibacterium sp. sgz301328]|uniref:lysophospholipid acyltransferase family protein n=1 Tax=Uliginosibacterium sp. sgz301328 TaxID=3243764 RepID=UPI00359EAA07
MSQLSFQRRLRANWRMLRVGCHLARGLGTVQFVFPFLSPERRRAVKQRWARKLVDILGIRLRQESIDLPPGSLVVSNHISWIDIFVINALTPTTFVCKDDVRGWPIIGWLVEHTGTVFIERGSRAAAVRTGEVISQRLQAGERIVFFPEGTTTDGSQLLPFRAALFQTAAESAAVAPLALRYVNADGARHPAPAYDGDITFGECMRAIAQADDLFATVEGLPLLPANLDRRELAVQSHRMLAVALGVASDTADVVGESEGPADEYSPLDAEENVALQSAPGC